MENITSVELKARAKELGVKSWWTLKKAELIVEIQKIQNDINECDESDYFEQMQITDREATKEAAQTQEAPVETDDKNIINESSNKSEKPSRKKVDLIEYNGKIQSLSAWARELNMPGQTLYARLHISNWPVEKAFTTPSRRKNKDDEEA